MRRKGPHKKVLCEYHKIHGKRGPLNCAECFREGQRVKAAAYLKKMFPRIFKEVK